MQFWDPLEATLGQLRVKFLQIWTQNEHNWGHLGPIFNQLGANLGPTWAFWVPSWRLFRMSWIHFGTHGGCKHETVQL